MSKNDQTGAEALVHSLIAGGIDTCFANPGTSEMHFVAALDTIPGIACVLGLQENTVTGMADGYFRVTGKPAATLLHCGPGYANGIANIHNARRAGSGMLNIVGDHAIPHVAFDSPLTADVDALVGVTSDWHAFGTAPERIGIDAARGIEAASKGYGQVASLVLPADVSWGKGGQAATAQPPQPPLAPSPSAISAVAKALATKPKAVMILGTPAVAADLHEVLQGLAEATDLTLMGSGTIASAPRGQGRLEISPVPYAVDEALKALSPFDLVILVNCPPPTGFFLYPGRPSLMHRPDAQVLTLSREDQDAAAALRGLAQALEAPPRPVPVPPPAPEVELQGPVTPLGFAAVVCRHLPKGAVVASEAMTLGGGFARLIPHAQACDWLSVTGGAIGGGIPMATGAAVGLRAMGQGHRRVISLQADGSAAYTLQGLWTQAREKLPVTTVLLNNRSYAILLGEYAKVGATPGPTAEAMMSLDNPSIDWADLARGFGVESHSVQTLEAFEQAFLAALEVQGPVLIDLRFA